MRAYSFTNFYLSSIQQGIQPAHMLVDLFTKYTVPSIERQTLFDWANHHKTMICLNGGTAGTLRDLLPRIAELATALQLPYGYFCEDEFSLDGTMTCVGLIVPELVYNFDPLQPELSPGITDRHIELHTLLRSYSLAK